MTGLRAATVALGFVTLALLACTVPLPGDNPANEEATAVREVQANPTPELPTTTPLTTPSPIGQDLSATPPPGGGTDGAAGCTLDGDFVSDVTVPDDSLLEAGTSFKKTWRVENSSKCAWDAETKLVFESGDRMEGPESVPVGAMAAASEVDISVNLEAPMEPGTYRGNWVLVAADGRRFGPQLYVRIRVPES
jgi:hypothetical protein